MKICANISCENESEKKHCCFKCQRQTYYRKDKEKIKLQGKAISEARKKEINKEVAKWQDLIKNSSLDTLRITIGLKPIEIKQADNFRDLITYI